MPGSMGLQKIASKTRTANWNHQDHYQEKASNAARITGMVLSANEQPDRTGIFSPPEEGSKLIRQIHCAWALEEE